MRQYVSGHDVNAKQEFRVSGKMNAAGLFGHAGFSVIRESERWHGA